MDNLSYIVYICIIVAFGLMLPLMQRQVRSVVIFMMIGVSACLFISEINSILLRAFDDDILYVTTSITPVTEEVAKALPILYYAIVKSSDRRSLIACSFAVGVGFALLENMIVLLQNVDGVTVLWALNRGFGSGLVHGLCTVTVGYGISYIKENRKLFRSGIFALLSTAITYHAVYNILVQSKYQNFGILLPVTSYVILILLYRKRNKERKKEGAHAAAE